MNIKIKKSKNITQNLDTNFKHLLNKFSIIKRKGYIESINNYNNGSGMTLEHYIGSTSGDFCIPDFEGIEIKAVRHYSDCSISLFSSSPDGKYITPNQWIAQNYGYPDKNFSNMKIINGTISGDKLYKIGLFYYFKLRVDYASLKIILEIYDYQKNLINNDIYWDFDSLEEKLYRKLQNLATVEFLKKYFNGKNYYKYQDIRMYKLKSFNTFLNLINDGIVSISFKVGIHKSGKYSGKYSDHGTTFKIDKINIEKLFTRIY